MTRPASRMIVALALCLSLTVAADASAYRRPNAPFKVGDPGVLFANGQWNVLATGSWSAPGTVSTAPDARGAYTLSGNHLLTRRPRWASRGNHSVWAPSEVALATPYGLPTSSSTPR